MSQPDRGSWLIDMPDCVKIARKGSIAIVTMNRPDKRNALSDELVLGLEATFAHVPQDIQAIVLTGAGDHFCGGLDLNEIREANIVESLETSKIGQNLNDKIQYCRVPVVSVLHGAVIGAGLELAAASHVRVAEESAFYALPEGMRGIFLGSGGSVRLPRLIGAAAVMDMMLSGRVYEAKEAHTTLRISQYLVADGEGLEAGIKLAERISQNAPLANFAVIQALPRIAEQAPSEGLFTEMLMTGIAQSDGEAKRRLYEFLVAKKNKVHRS